MEGARATLLVAGTHTRGMRLGDHAGDVAGAGARMRRANRVVNAP